MKEEPIRAIVIDDEAKARRVLSNILDKYCPDVEVVAICEDVLTGVEKIKALEPDVVFLDIEMPQYSGFELLGFFDGDVTFEVVFVTAYNEYALKAFEVSAVDYLLKPVRIDKLESAIVKLKQRLTAKNMHLRLEALKSNLQEEKVQKIVIPTASGALMLKVEDIVCVDADGSYSELRTVKYDKRVVSKNLKYFSQFLTERDGFYRVHRSHIVNIHFIKGYNKHAGVITLENDHTIKVSRDKRMQFWQTLTQIRP